MAGPLDEYLAREAQKQSQQQWGTLYGLSRKGMALAGMPYVTQAEQESRAKERQAGLDILSMTPGGQYLKSVGALGSPPSQPEAPQTRINVPAAGEGDMVQELAGVSAEEAPNPYAQMIQTLPQEKLLSTVPMGGQSSSTTTTTPGTALLPGVQQALERSSQQQQRAAMATAGAQAAGEESKAQIMEAHSAELRARQAQSEEQRAAMMARVESADAEASKIRADVAAAKIDPDRWWKTRSVGQISKLALAASLTARGAALLGSAGSNSVLNMISAAVDRDVEAQKESLSNKRYLLQDARGVVADLYKRVGDMQQAEAQARIMLTESVKFKLESVAAGAQAPALRAQAQQIAAGLDERLWLQKQQLYGESQDKTTRSSTSTTRQVPLIELLQAQAKATAKNEGKAAEPMPSEDRARLAAINTLRKDLAAYYAQFKSQGLSPGLTSWAGGEGAKTKEMRSRIINAYKEAFPRADTERLAGMLGGAFSTDADVKTRLVTIGKELEGVEQSILDNNADVGKDIKSAGARALEYRKKFNAVLGGSK